MWCLTVTDTINGRYNRYDSLGSDMRDFLSNTSLVCWGRVKNCQCQKTFCWVGRGSFIAILDSMYLSLRCRSGRDLGPYMYMVAGHFIKNMGVWRPTLQSNSALVTYMTLGNSLNLLESLFPHLWNEKFCLVCLFQRTVEGNIKEWSWMFFVLYI